MNKEIQTKLDTYPPEAQSRLLELRALIIETIATNNLGHHEETLKWNEPSYLVKYGSTVRIDWKPKAPEQYFLFFNCNTKLVDTFRELYADVLNFQGNRAIVLNLNEPLPVEAVQHCIELALQYKRIKHLPLLGVSHRKDLPERVGSSNNHEMGQTARAVHGEHRSKYE